MITSIYHINCYCIIDYNNHRQQQQVVINFSLNFVFVFSLCWCSWFASFDDSFFDFVIFFCSIFSCFLSTSIVRVLRFSFADKIFLINQLMKIYRSIFTDVCCKSFFVKIIHNFFLFSWLKNLLQFDFNSSRILLRYYHSRNNNYRLRHFFLRSIKTSIRAWFVEKHYQHSQRNNNYEFAIFSCSCITKTWYQSNFLRRI